MRFHVNVFEAGLEGGAGKTLIITQRSHPESVLMDFVNRAGYVLTNCAKEHSLGKISAFVLDKNGAPGKLIVEGVPHTKIALL